MTLPRDGQENRRCLHNIKTTSRTQEGGYVEGGSQSIHQPRIEVSAKVERKERERKRNQDSIERERDSERAASSRSKSQRQRLFSGIRIKWNMEREMRKNRASKVYEIKKLGNFFSDL